jgi:hypothetical protein
MNFTKQENDASVFPELLFLMQYGAMRLINAECL